MKRLNVMAGLLTMIICVGGCFGPAENSTAEESSEENQTTMEAVVEESDSETVTDELLDERDEFVSLVERYVENASFVSVEGEQEEQLTQLLAGHYEVTGRKADDGREYYMAVRRSDAPVYEDFRQLSVSYVYHAGSVEEICQIGYYGENAEEKVLYEIPGCFVINCMDLESEKALDMFCLIPQNQANDRTFLCAFQESGRKELDFIGKHLGLSHHGEGENCIDFFYQDDDTLEFYSAPYSCCISLDDGESEKIRALLEIGQDQEQEFEHHRATIEWLRTEDPSARTTGAVLNLDGNIYEILGSRGSKGYVIGRKEDMVCWLKDDQQIYSYVLDRIEDAVGKDYGDFTDTWFDSGLTKASLVFPRMEEGEDGEWTRTLGRQTITETEKLEQLSTLLGNAIRGHETLSGCPYVGVLDLQREDGETLRMFVAADSCDSITYDGRIGFEYGDQQDLAEIFDEAMGYQNGKSE